MEYARQLVARGSSTHHSHLQTLQTINQESSPKITKTKINNQQNNTNTNLYLLVGGLVLIGIVILVIGYWLGKKKNEPKLN